MDEAEEVIQTICAKFTNYKNQIVNEDKTIELWGATLSTMTYDQRKKAYKWLIYSSEEYAPRPDEYKARGFGLYSNRAAYELALRKEWKHAAIYHAANHSDLHNGRSLLSQEQRKQRFAECYKNICERVMLGEEFTLPQQNNLLEHKDLSSTELNKRYRSWLARTFGVDSKQVKDFDMFCKMSQKENMEYVQKHIKSLPNLVK